MTMRLDCHGITDVGRVRKANEDHFVIAALRKSVAVTHTSLSEAELGSRLRGPGGLLLAVADGVGGRPGGAIASSTVVSGLLEYLIEATGCFQRFDVAREHEFLERLEAGVREAHRALAAEHDGDAEKAPATTLTLALVIGPRAYLIHVGDSRAYYHHRGRLRRLTRDQTVGEYMVDLGAWTEQQAARASAGAALTSVIGGSEMTPSVGLVDLVPGDTLLLCTDGLTKHVDDDRIAAALAGPADAESACRTLVDQALADGGSDNVTVVVARALAPEPDS